MWVWRRYLSKSHNVTHFLLGRHCVFSNQFFSLFHGARCALATEKWSTPFLFPESALNYFCLMPHEIVQYLIRLLPGSHYKAFATEVRSGPEIVFSQSNFRHLKCLFYWCRSSTNHRLLLLHKPKVSAKKKQNTIFDPCWVKKLHVREEIRMSLEFQFHCFGFPCFKFIAFHQCDSKCWYVFTYILENCFQFVGMWSPDDNFCLVDV